MKDLVRNFLDENQSWIRDVETVALITTGQPDICREQSTRKITPDEIERWLISMWELNIEDQKRREEAQRIEIDRNTRIQHNDSHDEVRWKIHKMLRQLENDKGGIIIGGEIDNKHKDGIINGLRSILSVNKNWMIQLQAIAATATNTPDALQPGSQLPLSYQRIQDWAAAMWTIGQERRC